MSDFRSLKILDRFQSLFHKLHIDYDMMRKIIKMKLTMDKRRVPTIFNQDMSKKKADTNQFLKSLLIYGLYGLILVPFMWIDHYMMQMAIIFGMAMFILMTSMIADFSSVLLDVRDKTILGTKPIDTRTINAAKLIHVGIYLSLITGAFLVIPSVFMIGVQGFFVFLLFFLEVIFLVLFILAITALIYIFILKYFDSERLKDIINYVQIFLAIAVVIGYQVLIRLFDIVDLNIVYQFSWWHLLIPPIWFAAPFQLFFNQDFSFGITLLSLLAVIGPVVAFMLYYRFMPVFESNLQKLMEETGKKKRKRRPLLNLFARVVCFNKTERAYFKYASLMMSQERDFKLKVYPSLGMALAFPFIFLLNNMNMGTSVDFTTSKLYFMIYFINIIIGTVVFMLRFSSKYKGSWIFQVTPYTDSATVYSATLKAFIVRLYVPIYLLVAISFVFIFSVRIIPDLIVIFVAAILYTLISYVIVNKGAYPFSEPYEAGQQGGNSLTLFLLMIIVGVLAFIHFIMLHVTFGLYIYLGILLIATFVGWKIVFKRK